MLARFIVTVLGLMLLCSPALAGEVRLFAAASLTNAMKEVCALYAQGHPEVTFIQHYASSGTLAKQVEAGSPADLFVSANPLWMDFLRDEGLVTPESIGVLTRNELVFVGRPRGGAVVLDDLPGLERIAIGSPGSVPAGQYARQALETAGLYDGLAAARALVFAKDVRQALIYADRGEVDGAFVYRTDALLARQAGILFEVPPEFYPQVTYPAALTLSGRRRPEAAAFYDYLKGTEALAVFKRHGFLVN